MNLDCVTTGMPPYPLPDIAKYLLEIPKPGEYHPRVAAILAAASTWAYSDLGTFADRMCRLGLIGHCVEISTRNDAMLLDTSLYLFQGCEPKEQPDKSIIPGDPNGLIILAARGTMPTNLINWMMDASTQKVPFMNGKGAVHSGMYLGAMSIWVVLRELLKTAASKSGSKTICHRAKELTSFTNMSPGAKGDKDLAIYVTGHSLAGAFASLLAAGIHMDPQVSEIADSIRTVCAFGPPMCADEMLAANLETTVGKSLLWFKFQNDVVPQLPGRTLGKFAHFGRRFVSSSAEGVWVQENRPARQALGNIASNVIGALAWMKNNAPWLRNINLPFSWADHSPGNYWATSLRAYPFDFLLL